MIGAVQLRLPELSSEGAEALASAERMLKRFNPEEPRDWRGRWADAGNEVAQDKMRGARPVSTRTTDRQPKPQLARPATATSAQRTARIAQPWSRPSAAGAAAIAPPPLSPMVWAQRLAIGEEIVGGGPEDPVADVAALVTLGVGALIAGLASRPRRSAPGGRRARGYGQSQTSPLGAGDDECEEQLRRDMINCQIVRATRGQGKASQCRAVATQRYSECLVGGPSSVRTPPYWGN
jgi:hypothetical protein